ncbi:transmembrane O-methyltransferase homolog isoform X3 [Tachysurus fulvidraco]|uniref:transmembrane O-methyltransferase homolog isoform X3 n=1 Tax=Tachysurus fulvidraco TaxID=1234273 RepID=UPI001FED8C58|nr:transmembrane O-methyltransferase homolog isoform X3 [Tachysurus fulvidraco]
METLLLLSLPLLSVIITLCHSPLRALYRCVCEKVLKILCGKVCVRRTHAYIFSECTHGQAESVLATFDLYSKKHASASIGPEKGYKCVFLDEVIQRKAPLRVLELGMHCGYTSVRILRMLPTFGKLFTVEMDPLTAEKGEEIILVAGFKNSQFQVLPCSSAEAISNLASHLGEERLDLVVMDHDPEQYLPDFLALQRFNLLSKHRVVTAGAQAVMEYLSTKPHNYSMCQQVKDMLEIRCHMEREDN